MQKQPCAYRISVKNTNICKRTATGPEAVRQPTADRAAVAFFSVYASTTLMT